MKNMFLYKWYKPSSGGLFNVQEPIVNPSFTAPGEGNLAPDYFQDLGTGGSFNFAELFKPLFYV